MLADGLEDRDDIDRLAAIIARQDRPAIDEDRRPIEPRQTDEAAGHVLVATANGHQPVEALAPCHRLDGVGDDLAGNQRVFHALRTHGNAIGDRDGVEDHRFAARFVHPQGHVHREVVDMNVARRHLAPGRDHADLRLVEIFLLEPDGVEHGPARRPLRSVHDDRRVRAKIGGILFGW